MGNSSDLIKVSKAIKDSVCDSLEEIIQNRLDYMRSSLSQNFAEKTDLVEASKAVQDSVEELVRDQLELFRLSFSASLLAGIEQLKQEVTDLRISMSEEIATLRRELPDGLLRK